MNRDSCKESLYFFYHFIKSWIIMQFFDETRNWLKSLILISFLTLLQCISFSPMLRNHCGDCLCIIVIDLQTTT